MQLAIQATDGKPEDLAGVVVDNTKANRNAVVLLEERNPTWIALGCQAYALNWLFKEYAHKDSCRYGWLLHWLACI